MSSHVLWLLPVVLCGCQSLVPTRQPLEARQELWSAEWDAWSETNDLNCADEQILTKNHLSTSRACVYWRVQDNPALAKEVIVGWQAEGLQSRLLSTLEARELIRQEKWGVALETLGKYPVDFQALSGEITIRALALIKLGQIEQAREYLSFYLDRRRGNFRWEAMAAVVGADQVERERRARRALDRAPAESMWAKMAQQTLVREDSE